ncbi:MAG TPA: MFS transporter [Candidatus Kapabacteria bacterium]|nr:MFS transporter [Candidatus Kapabacteria bacterium]
MQQLKKSVVAAWSMFDFANSSFAIIMSTFVFPQFYTGVIVNNPNKDLYWGLTLSGSMLLVALIAPGLGAIADSTGSKKKFLFAFTLAAVLGTAAAYWLDSGMIILGSVIFIIANAGFEGGTVFYDAFLPQIAPPEKIGRVSGIGFAVGYLGSLAALAATIPFLTKGLYKETFLVTAAMFLFFSLPIFLFVPEGSNVRGRFSFRTIGDGLREVRKTMRNLRKHRSLSMFLVAFFIYNDAILTVIGFAGIYAKDTLRFGMQELIILYAMVQTVAIAGSLIFGVVTDKLGPKTTIIITLFIWLGVVIGAFFATDAVSFYIVAIFAGISLGSSQSASRSMMALLTPIEHTAEFFGFYDGFAGKASAVIGPLVFGALSAAFGQRQAILSLVLFFGSGLLLIRRVRPTSKYATA